MIITVTKNYDSFQRVSEIVLHGFFLYVAMTPMYYIQILDLSNQKGFNYVPRNYSFKMFPEWGSPKICSIVVTTSGDVLVVQNNLYETNIENRKSIFKKDPKANPKEHYNLVEIDSLGDEEAMLLDLGVTVPGIEPNSIYFTRHDRVFLRKHLKLDICVFNLETKTLKSFGSLSNLKLKDAR